MSNSKPTLFNTTTMAASPTAYPDPIPPMKRPSGSSEGSDGEPPADEMKHKKPRSDEEEEEVVEAPESLAAAAAAELGEDLVFEVLRRADARTLAAAACVSRRWRAMAEDERLWEAVCTRHWASVGCGDRQLRSVVLALGGFRRLHSLYLLPLLNQQPHLRPSPPPPLSSSLPSSSSSRKPNRLPARWGKDEVQLSLSLLSIGYFEKMNPLDFNKQNTG